MARNGGDTKPSSGAGFPGGQLKWSSWQKFLCGMSATTQQEFCPTLGPKPFYIECGTHLSLHGAQQWTSFWLDRGRKQEGYGRRKEQRHGLLVRRTSRKVDMLQQKSIRRIELGVGW